LSLRDLASVVLKSWWGKIITAILSFGAVFSVYTNVTNYMSKFAEKTVMASEISRVESQAVQNLKSFELQQQKKFNYYDLNMQTQILKERQKRLTSNKNEVQEKLRNTPNDQYLLNKLTDLNKQLDEIDKELESLENKKLGIFK
jgi:hypothetical protein